MISGGSEGVNYIMSEGKKNFHFRRSLVYKDTDTQKKFLLFKPVMGLKSINKIKKHFIYF